MLSKISLLASLLFFLLYSNVFAYSSYQEVSPANNGAVNTESFHAHSTFASLKTANKKAMLVSAAEINKNNTENAALPAIKNNSIKPSFKDYIVPGAVCLILLFGFSSYWLIYRRKYVPKET